MKFKRRYHHLGPLCLLLVFWGFSQIFHKYISVNFLQGSQNDTDDDDDDDPPGFIFIKYWVNEAIHSSWWITIKVSFLLYP